MKKKVFSLMMTLLLGFFGLAQAQQSLPFTEGFENGIGSWTMSNCHSLTGVTTTSSYVHEGSAAFAFHWYTQPPQYLISPELAGAEEGLDVEFFYYATSSYYDETFQVGYSTTTNDVNSFTFEDEVTATYADGWGTYTTSFPAGTKYVAVKCTSNDAFYLSVDDFSFTAGEGGDEPVNPDEPGYTDGLHVLSADGTIDTVNVGSRPLNAWMAPYVFKMYNESNEDYTVTVLDFTPNDGVFENLTEVPYELAAGDTTDITIDVHPTEAGVINRQFVAIYEGTRLAHIWPITAEAYTPICPDVVEVAYVLNDGEPIEPGFTWKEFMSTIWAGEDTMDLHNDYTLPYPEVPEGKDAVMKFTLDKAMMLSAKVSTGENGKVALYTEDFYGEDGPMADNNYTERPMSAGGSANTTIDFETGDFSQFNNYTNDSNYPWVVTADAAYTGSFGMKSGNAGVASSTSAFTATVNYTRDGSISFDYAAWGEGSSTYWDHCDFYIDGTRVIYAGASQAWNQFSQEITAGEHTFKWSYTKDSSVNPTVDCFKVDNIVFDGGRMRTDTPANVLFADDFENGLDNWTLVDNGDPEGDGWMQGDPSIWSIGDAHSGNYIAASWSWNGDAIDQDAWMITPMVEGATSINYFVSTNTYYPDFYYVMASTTDNNISSFTSVFSETAYSGSKSGNGHKSSRFGGGNRDMSAWAERTIELPEGTKYVAFRHVDYDMNFLFIDDVTISAASTEPEEPVVAGVGPEIDSLNVVAGTYYLVASSTDDDFEVEINIDELPCPFEGVTQIYPEDNAEGIEPNSVTLRWKLNPYCTEYRLVFSSTYWPDDEPNNPFTIITDWSSDLAESYTVTNLFNNTNYFWRIDQRSNGGEEEGGCTVTGEVFGFTTHFNKPQNLVATPDEIFEGQTVTLTWNAVVDRTYRMYRIYKDGELIGTTDMNQINATSFVVPASELTYNMNGYIFNVTAVYDEGESDFSNDAEVKVSGYSNATGINGYAYEQDGETPIEGVTVTITGTDEFDNEHVYTATTDENGYYHVQVYVGNYTMAVANKEGYQTTVTNHELPFDVALNGQVDNVNFIMDENFVAPAHVCAELVEVDGEELVKVWWDFDFYNALIEDFETGDFTQFPWQNSASYPWTITTTNPYEGTYCMKSGGAGVANVQSDMSVTVDVPNDGLISFFAKISCESSWDYGYFYIDGTQVGSFTGAGNWTEKKYDITAGEHTFKWSYQKDFSVNANDDCFYVDYITFNMIPEPLTAGWHTYLEGEFNDALRSNLTDQPSFGYHYPTSITTQYNGFQLTKVSMFSDSEYGAVGGNYTVNIYQGGSTPGAGTLVSTKTVDLPVGLGEWVDWDLDTPVAVSGDQDLWVIWHVNQAGGLGYPAGMCNTDSNPNGDWWDGGSGWENYGGGVWTMRNFFNDGSRDVVLAAGNTPIADNNLISSNLRTFVKGDNTVTAERINPNAPVVKPAKSAMRGDRALDHYNIYRTSCYNDGPYTSENTVLLATAWRPDTAYFDVSWPEVEPGVYKWGVSVVYAGNRDDEPTVYPAEDRESDIVWSNMCDCGMGCIDKDMTIDSLVTVNVLLNSADSPEGTVVTFTNLNEGEQANHPMDPITLDATGFYRFPSFRKGDYTVTVEHDGYETITDTPVSIWEPVDLRYVMIEILYGIDNLYVSRTGWAMWEGNAMPDDPDDPDQPGETFFDDFEAGNLNNWTVIDNGNPAGAAWHYRDVNDFYFWNPVPTAHSGNGVAMSWSYDGDAIQQNCYMISPLVAGATQVSYWVSVNESYPDHYQVMASTTGTDIADFTVVFEEGNRTGGSGSRTTMTAGDNRAQTPWAEKVVELPAGTKYVAFHHEAYDQNYLFIDDVTISTSRNAGERHLEYYKVMCESIDHEPIFNANTTHNFCQVATDQLVEGEQYICKVAAVYSTGQGPWSEVVWQYESCENYAGTVDGVTVEGNTVSWTYPEGGDTPDPDPDPEGDVIVILTENNVWGDGSGYQMLLDADATAYGNEIPTSGPYTGSNYNAFEYLIPEDADCSGYATHVVSNGSVSITIPAGTYDWCITNPTGGTNWIAAQNGNVGGRQDNYVFEAGKTYEFVPAMFGSNDGVNVTITENGKIYGVAGNNAVVDNSNCRVNENYDATASFTSVGPASHNNPDAYHGLINRDGYIQYCTDTYGGGIGTGGGQVWWAVMYTPAQLAAYNGQNVTKVGVYTGTGYGHTYTGNYTASVYQGGTTAPGTLMATKTENITVEDAWYDLTLDSPVTIDASQNLWFVFTATLAYPMSHCDTYSGDLNSTWASLDGVTWDHVGNMGVDPATWMIRAYVEQGTPTPTPGDTDCIGAMIFVDGEWEAFVPAPTNTYTYEGEGENICVRMVYDGEAELPDNNFYYAMSCEECAVPEQGCAPVENLTGYYQNDPEYGEAIFVEWDEPEGVVSYELYIGGELAGTLEPGGLPVVIYGLEGYPAFTLPIGVVAVYDDCESEMVEVNVNYDEVPENNLEVALFPNPTKDNVTIQAAGMNHITVMSVLGQVVYDAEVSSDEVILNMSQFNAGVYVVRIVTSNGVGTRRVTVVK